MKRPQHADGGPDQPLFAACATGVDQHPRGVPRQRHIVRGCPLGGKGGLQGFGTGFSALGQPRHHLIRGGGPDVGASVTSADPVTGSAASATEAANQNRETLVHDRNGR